jgi:aminopeptidase N
VGDFECEQGAADGIPIRVCGTPDKKGMGQFALKAAEFTLHYYDQYFGIKYPTESWTLSESRTFLPGRWKM